MHRWSIVVVSAALSAWPVGDPHADLQIGATVTDEGLQSFHLALGDFYRVPERDVLALRARRIPDDELAVVFFLAEHARQSPEVIVDLRLGGESWIDIAWRFGVSSKVFYVPFERTPGPPYGRAYGHFKRANRSDWPRLRLPDADVINLVNLRFVMDRYRCSADDVVRLRGAGESFPRLAADIEKRRGKSGEARQGKSEPGRGKHKGRGRR